MYEYGRQAIYTAYPFVTRSNLQNILQVAFGIFGQNSRDADELYRIYRGEQKILKRKKEVRPNIQYNTVVNYANEIVSFKTAYFLSEPLQYVSAGEGGDRDQNGVPDLVDKLNRLTRYMRAENKAAKDKTLVDWQNICGTGYRLVLPAQEQRDGDRESPFHVYTLDPRTTFVVYYGGVDHHPVLAGVVVPKDDNTGCYLSCYARVEDGGIVFFDLDYPALPFNYYMGGEGGNTKVWTGENARWPTEVKPLDLPDIPVIEYPANMARLGSFEVVLGLLDQINLLATDQAESVEQNVQSLLVFQNCKVSQTQLDKAAAGAALEISSEGGSGQESKVYTVSNALDMAGTRGAMESARSQMLEICGMPATQNGSASTSDTGSAVIMRDGWQQAESRAKDLETLFRESESRFLEIALYITRYLTDLDLYPQDIVPKFNRRNYADLLTRVQSLTTMLDNGKIAPQLAFEHSGLFTDPEAAFAMSAAYVAEQERKAAEQQAQETETAAQENAGTDTEATETVPETQQGASA